MNNMNSRFRDLRKKEAFYIIKEKTHVYCYSLFTKDNYRLIGLMQFYYASPLW